MCVCVRARMCLSFLSGCKSGLKWTPTRKTESVLGVQVLTGGCVPGHDHVLVAPDRGFDIGGHHCWVKIPDLFQAEMDPGSELGGVPL